MRTKGALKDRDNYVVKKRVSIYISVNSDIALANCAKATKGIPSKNMMAVKIIQDYLIANNYLSKEACI